LNLKGEFEVGLGGIVARKNQLMRIDERGWTNFCDIVAVTFDIFNYRLSK